MKNRKKEKDYAPTLTISKVFVMFALILALRLNVDILLLNVLLIISAIKFWLLIIKRVELNGAY